MHGGPAFAAPGVALKAVAENAIAEAIAIIEIVFMFWVSGTGCRYSTW
jgi:hypothetical protein